MRTLGTLCAVVGLFASAASAAPIKILITDFEPFGGASINYSRNVGDAIGGLLAGPFEVTLCTLPVVYDAGAKQAMKCLTAMSAKPDVVLSLGEGGCDIRLETRAENWDADGTDNAGNNRTGSRVVANAPNWLPLTFPVAQMLQVAQPDEWRGYIVRSTSAGNYVCNNTAFNLANNMNRPGDPLYGFIHVPNHSCSGDTADPIEVAGVISRMIKATIPDAVAQAKALENKTASP